MYLKSAETGNKYVGVYKVCGKLDCSKFFICGVYLNFMDNRGQAAGRTCFFDYHNDDFFGLARSDSGLSKTKGKDRNYPSLAKKR